MLQAACLSLGSVCGTGGAVAATFGTAGPGLEAVGANSGFPGSVVALDFVVLISALVPLLGLVYTTLQLPVALFVVHPQLGSVSRFEIAAERTYPVAVAGVASAWPAAHLQMLSPLLASAV